MEYILYFVIAVDHIELEHTIVLFFNILGT